MGGGEGRGSPSCDRAVPHLFTSPQPTQTWPYLQCLGDPGFGGLVHLRLPHAPAARLAQVAQTEAQVLLVGVLFDLGEGKAFWSQSSPYQLSQSCRHLFRHLLGPKCSELC